LSNCFCRFGNWHSILRCGLKNYSGTKFQTHGTAYGNGIYLAADSSTSLGYAQNVPVRSFAQAR
jgi:hypothetical protein